MVNRYTTINKYSSPNLTQTTWLRVRKGADISSSKHLMNSLIFLYPVIWLLTSAPVKPTFCRRIISPSLFMLVLFFFLIPTGCSEEKSIKLQGVSFDNQWIEVQPSQPLHFTDSLTIDLYIKLHEYPTDWTTIIAKRETDHKNEFSLRLKNKNNGHWYFGSESAVTVLRWDPEKLLPLDEWVRLTLVRDYSKNKLVMYKNCEPVLSKQFIPFPRIQKTDVPITLLRQGNQCLHATLAEIRIWDRALSPGMIKQVFFGTPINKHKISPVALWRFRPLSNISGYGKAFLQPEIFPENS